MIELSTTWHQTAQALEQEDFDAAYGILDGAFGEATRAQRGALALLGASVTSLYGDGGVDDTRKALRDAVTLDPHLREDRLYRAVLAELTARDEPSRGADLARGALTAPLRLGLPDEEAVARFHAMVALALSDQPVEALDVAPASADLPAHLRWRLRSWQADCEEQLGHHEDAANLYAEAAHLAVGESRAIMRQEQAAVLLQLERHQEALDLLDRARQESGAAGPDDELNLANWHYLRAQAELGLGQDEQALTSIRAASRLEREAGDPSYGVELVWGQVLVARAEMEEAVTHFERALELARPQDRPYALHELGVAYLDMDKPVEARDRLQEVLAHDEYPFLPEVYADLGEAEYRLGRLQEAEQNAQYALSQGATVPASLVLGSVALDYYHLDEALEHYERVIREAAPGTRDWVTGHQMAADILAQQGFRDPAGIYSHASQAIEHTERSDEWYATLSDLMRRAEREMKGGNRTLN
ncbi:tetratricopeptide repeat protein [Deinococcus pimensis]|uniref:tetratricopeptide repeat protein n=1 Tax=Deinococcus pimensis TaxID=309888 RepID=UPI0004880D6D|nr:tetratricopeptide repeat protein [Deinococcus pimensis]